VFKGFFDLKFTNGVVWISGRNNPIVVSTPGNFNGYIPGAMSLGLNISLGFANGTRDKAKISSTNWRRIVALDQG
jgi:hypothetical protein